LLIKDINPALLRSGTGAQECDAMKALSMVQQPGTKNNKLRIKAGILYGRSGMLILLFILLPAYAIQF
jgi:hypothetical protein